jgi:cytoskeletal protein RodZ
LVTVPSRREYKENRRLSPHPEASTGGAEDLAAEDLAVGRRGVSIGDTLAEARRQADLTVTQVSQRTCIRETIIRGIERGDYSACGGDFYARGHIRSIARAVGVDPEPLVREYDHTQGAPQAISAADVFEPATPIKIKERRRPNWSVVLAIALAAIIGFVIYHEVSKPGPPPHSNPAASAAGVSHPSSSPHTATGRASAGATPSKPAATPASQPYANEVVISLTANQACWVQLTTASGTQVYAGVVGAGNSMHWTERQAVSLRLGNPGGVSLTVNGRSQTAGTSHQPVTLSLGPGQNSQS